jgi:hypothetical protein
MSDLLAERFPESPVEERKRFERGFQNEASGRLEAYLRWRDEYDLDSFANLKSLSDEEDWIEAVNKALSHHSNDTNAKQQRNRRRSKRQREERIKEIPQLLFSPSLNDRPITDSKGNLLLHHLPARIDLKAHSIEIYASIFALYLDRKLSRDDENTITILIDVRPGMGWPNPPAIHLINFIRQVAHLLNELYPCRLYKCILYPVPRTAFYTWHMIRSFLHSNVKDAIVLLPGGAHVDSPIPTETLQKHVSQGLEELEENRFAAFDE